MFSEEELKRGLETQVFGRTLYVSDSIDSTNALAKTLAAKGAAEGAVVIADYQTAGRGRLGRSWQAEAGSNLLFSLILRPAISKDKIGLLPFYSSVGVALPVETITGKNCECKWPNDILLNKKKCCGMLLESSFKKDKPEYVVIGIGLNVNQKSFHGELEDKATSLSKECGTEFERSALFCRIMASMELLYKAVSKGDFTNVLKEWKARATIMGTRITLTQGDTPIEGIAAALSDDGGLVVETKSGQRVFHSGDVTVAKQ
jgi:BirA family transcriptional regulator, biotin operon repressor / biotin---[acetyl-CoA-carboxylase] ligase